MLHYPSSMNFLSVSLVDLFIPQHLFVNMHGSYIYICNIILFDNYLFNVTNHFLNETHTFFIYAWTGYGSSYNNLDYLCGAAGRENCFSLLCSSHDLSVVL